MRDYEVSWDADLRGNLRLWPEPRPNTLALVECRDEPYDGQHFLQVANQLAEEQGESADEHDGEFGEEAEGEQPDAADGEVEQPVEDDELEAPGASKRPNTARSLRNFFEPLAYAGLAYRDDADILRLSPLGECVLPFFGAPAEYAVANENNLDLVGRLLIKAASLIVECRAIWQMLLAADGYLTNDELNRAMGITTKLSDASVAGQLVVEARKSGDLGSVGDGHYAGDAIRKAINPQFLLAGGGGAVISLEQRSPERRLAGWAIPLIEEALSDPTPQHHVSTDQEAVLRMSAHASAPGNLALRTYGEATEAKIQEVVETCELHGSDSIVVLSGVAGTGKTFVALAAAQRYAKSPLLVKQVQFHQSYSYEDFMEGFRPQEDGGFKVLDGLFLQWNDRALRDPDNHYVLLVEEFSRANINAVFGELMTYVEHRNRQFDTPISRRTVQVASNLTILATMNPRDRSALDVDDAMIRRLRIIDCPPDMGQLREMLAASLEFGSDDEAESEVIAPLIAMFEKCQAYPDYESTMPFGHGMFAGVRNAADLNRLWNQRIKHLLRRPMVQPHKYCEDIEANYPWRTVAVPGTAAADQPSALATGTSSEDEIAESAPDAELDTGGDNDTPPGQQ